MTHRLHVSDDTIKVHHSILVCESLVTHDNSNKQYNSTSKRKNQ